MSQRLKHIGVDAFLAERDGLLDAYDKAKSQTSDDPIQVEHGLEGEGIIRRWLHSFLPRRFDVCKGHIITTNLNYEGPLEDWDVIIYDALESPVLFTRGVKGSETEKRAIPIEYVRAVLEVKATFNPSMAEQAATKLKKLQSFIGQNISVDHPRFLCEPFVCGTIFFETDVDNLSQYRNALNKLCALLQVSPILPFMGSLILRSQRVHSHSGYLQPMISDEPIDWPDVFEMSSSFQYPDGGFGILGCGSYSVHSFPTFMFDLLKHIKGNRSKTISSFYGLDFENAVGSRLFH